MASNLPTDFEDWTDPEYTVSRADPSVYKWATVVSEDPLRIRFDGDPVILPDSPNTLVAGLKEGQRVWCQLHGRLVIIVGVGGGVPLPEPPEPEPLPHIWEGEVGLEIPVPSGSGGVNVNIVFGSPMSAVPSVTITASHPNISPGARVTSQNVNGFTARFDRSGSATYWFNYQAFVPEA